LEKAAKLSRERLLDAYARSSAEKPI